MSPDDFDARLRDALREEPLSIEVSASESRAQLEALHQRLTLEARDGGSPTAMPPRAKPVTVARIGGRHLPSPRLMIGIASAAVAILVAIVTIPILRNGRDASARPAVVATYRTHHGQRADVTLADGSQVTLAPATTLRVERGVGQNGVTRLVLDGEAFFRVTHNIHAPFLVVTGNITTRVLGTSFDVRHYAADPRVRVAVADGKVSVGVATPGAPSVTATAGVVAVVTDSTAETITAGDVSNYTAWSQGTLAFRHMRTSDVLETLGQWYGYEFKLRDSTLASHLLTVRFDGESEATVLRSLGVILDVTMTFDGRVVTLTPRSSATMPVRGASDRERTRPTLQTEVGR